MEKLKTILGKHEINEFEIIELGSDITDAKTQIVASGYGSQHHIASVVFENEKGKYVLGIRNANAKFKSGALKKFSNSKKLKMVSPDVLAKLSQIAGSVCPLTIDPKEVIVVIDESVAVMSDIVCGTGTIENAIKLSRQDFEKVMGAKYVRVAEVQYVRNENELDRYLSGVAPSASEVHLGNYLGAMKQFVDFQNTPGTENYYFLADYHAINTVHEGSSLRSNTQNVMLDYLGAGVDPEKSVFYIESQIPEIFEMTEVLNNAVTLGEMKRMHGYKDKLADPNQDENSINMGLFNYPILMAADILLFEPDFIPVGEDQAQHVEICRDMARSFNSRYGDILKIPELYVKEATGRVIGTDGERKMSKSIGNILGIFSDDNVIKKQIMAITTDPARIKVDDPGDPDKNPIFYYLEIIGHDKSKIEEYRERYRKGTIGDVEFKKEFFEIYREYISPMRDRRAKYAKDMDYVNDMVKENGKKARDVAMGVMDRVRTAIGVYRV